ncbi:long-chain fatty alcohol dehydrogenase [Backusella circina FSU 941]|nr:long-chain fatty alcohol dehydrogenase [Backusella circina FSU 941]KAI8884941.1 long-chain fatty alcohol dehydrogenase [Backusella circina FSU 941]
MTVNDPFRFRVAANIEFSDSQKATLESILDTFIAPLTKAEEDALVQKLSATHSEDTVRNYARISNSSIKSFEAVNDFINHAVVAEKRRELLLLLSLLSTKAGTFALTGHFDEFKNLPHVDREKVFLNWKDSFLPQLRLIYKTFHSLACYPVYGAHSEVVSDAMKYRLPDLEENHDELYEHTPEKLNMLAAEDIKSDTVFDTIIIGSGAGGGVVASKLAAAGKSVLVIEKGAYYHEKEFLHREATAMERMYETHGFAPSYEGSINILAGSVFGGGTTINWCASLKLQHFVREEWAKQGLTHFLTPKFSEDLDKVFDRIGASTSGIQHNGSNQVLVDGCKKLGYPIADIPQNTGGKAHSCNFCYAGCKGGIKNGTMNTWLRDAYQHNAKFMDKTKVTRVLIKNGKVTGVECLPNLSDKTIQIQADQVVVSAGSLQSPGVLLRSGLKNKHIGHHLRLHPCALAFGYFDRPISTSQGSIMTAVSNVVENVDNEGYGAKLEVPLLHPGSFSSVLPWRGAAHHKDLMMRYDHCAPILILTRDKDSTGVVRYDDKQNFVVDWNLSSHDRQSMLAGIERSCNILAAAGAREIHTGQFGVEPFYFEQGEEPRADHPRFLAWKEGVRKYGLPQDGSGVFCAHQMGTCRMGISPKVSVAKPTGETWEVKNLYVADASLLPTATGVNPMVTTEAVCLHVADSILDKKTSKL